MRLFAVDTMAVLYRSHFALIRNPLINSRGVNVSGLRGLVWTLLALLERERPEYLAVVADSPEPTFRHQAYGPYKATREKMPAELVGQLPYIPRLVQALGLPYLVMPGFEAYDIIGTLVRQATQQGLEVMMVSGDKDYLQLVSERVRMVQLKGEDMLVTGLEGVAARFGCGPEGVVQVLALMGDASDNVPGVKGVGEKTAIKLVQTFGTLENLYQNLEQVKGDKLKATLAAERELAFLSRELVTIRQDVPLAVGLDALRLPEGSPAHNAAFVALLAELELHQFRDKLLGQREQATPKPALDWHVLDSLEAVAGLLPRWRQAELLAVDTETTGLNVMGDRIVGISLACGPQEAWYIPLNAPALSTQRQALLDLLRPLLEGKTPPKCGHNLKFDMHMLLTEGIALGGLAQDTLIASHLLEPAERRHDLDSVALRRLGLTKIPTESLLGKGKTQTTMDQLPIPQVAEYACEDAEATWRLAQIFAPQLAEQGEETMFRQVEMALLPVLMHMERAGVRFDTQGAQALSAELAGRLDALREQVYEIAGEREFNVNSVPDLQRILYEKLKLHEVLNVRLRKIKTGIGFSTDEETLEKLAAHPLPRTLLAYRQLAKLKNTYLDALPGFVHPADGRIHTTFRQAVAATGRLASDNPNLQNIPVRSSEGQKVRALFLPADSEHVLLSADYSQIELRVVADYSRDPTFLEAYRTNQDIHSLTAQAIFQIGPQKVTREQRAVAKEVNFGLIYRMGPDRLSLVTGTSREDAKAFIERFFSRYGAVRQMQDDLMASARKEGYAQTRLGRRRYLPEISQPDSLAGRTAEGMAINTPIQGTAAEIIKLAMIRVDRRLRQEKLRSRMVLTIHDELLFDVPKAELAAVQRLATEEMEAAMTLAVPLKVDIGYGPNWLEAKH